MIGLEFSEANLGILIYKNMSLLLASTGRANTIFQVRLPLANVDFQKGTDQWVEIEKLTNGEGQR